MKVKYLYIAYMSNFLENINLFSSYDGVLSHQIWFSLDQGKQSYGGGVGNVLNRPGEIGLRPVSRTGQTNRIV